MLKLILKKRKIFFGKLILYELYARKILLLLNPTTASLFLAKIYDDGALKN